MLAGLTFKFVLEALQAVPVEVVYSYRTGQAIYQLRASAGVCCVVIPTAVRPHMASAGIRGSPLVPSIVLAGR